MQDDTTEPRKSPDFIPYEKVAFELTPEQVDKLNGWLIEVEKRAKQSQIDKAEQSGRMAQGGKRPYYGAIGGGLTFSFSNNALGTVCKVTEEVTGETFDLTDYDW